jgi:hypothetical protein
MCVIGPKIPRNSINFPQLLPVAQCRLNVPYRYNYRYCSVAMYRTRNCAHQQRTAASAAPSSVTVNGAAAG